MTDTASESAGERLLTFEVADIVYALPIAEVLEVTESTRLTCIPTLPRRIGGVMNWHGEAIPVIASDLLLCPDGADDGIEAGSGSGSDEGSSGTEAEAEDGDRHVLVVSDRPEDSARMGLSVDRIHGLVNGPRRPAPTGSVVIERRPLDGRVVSVIDPQCLVNRAEEVIRRAAE